jgi:hypothetical protein
VPGFETELAFLPTMLTRFSDNEGVRCGHVFQGQARETLSPKMLSEALVITLIEGINKSSLDLE